MCIVPRVIRTWCRVAVPVLTVAILLALRVTGAIAEDAPKASDQNAPPAEAQPEAAKAAAPNGEAGAHEDEAHGPDGPMTAKPAEADLALWTLITFCVFLYVLSKMAWKPLTEGLDKREAKIFGALSDAETSRIKAQKLLEDHQHKLDRVQDQVREILAEARRDAETTKSSIIATAEREAETLRKRAIVDIERARDAALDELFDHMTHSVRKATHQVVGRSLTGDDHDRLIREVLQEFSARRS